MQIPRVSRPYMPGYGIAGADQGSGLLDPAVNATFGVRPHRVFGVQDADLTGSPTRWIFED